MNVQTKDWEVKNYPVVPNTMGNGSSNGNGFKKNGLETVHHENHSDIEGVPNIQA
jgi:hypothetical protein